MSLQGEEIEVIDRWEEMEAIVRGDDEMVDEQMPMRLIICALKML